jgi:Ca-activated chloride channel family protein
VRVELAKNRYRAGESVHLKVQASASTRTITATLYGAGPVWLRWNATESANTGDVVVPSTLPPGRYPMQIVAEDAAHNIGSKEVSLEVLP